MYIKVGANARSFIIIMPFIFFHSLQDTCKNNNQQKLNHPSTDNPSKASFSFKGRRIKTT